MPALIREKTTPITIDGTNVVYIRSEMNLGMQTRIADGLKPSKNGKGFALGIGEAEAMMLLLRESVADWEGPEFEDEAGRKIPCTPYALEWFNPQDPLFQKVREEVLEMYKNLTEGLSPNLPQSKRTTKSTSKP